MELSVGDRGRDGTPGCFFFSSESSARRWGWLSSHYGAVAHYAVLTSSVQDINYLWLLDQSVFRLILITCYPFDALVPGGNERFVIMAEHIVL